MNWFNKLPGYRQTPAGPERVLLRRLPKALLLGTLGLALVAGVARLLPWSGSESEITTKLDLLDIYIIGFLVLHWTIVLTLGIGAFIVMIMKGPAYVADAYPLDDADQPHKLP